MYVTVEAWRALDFHDDKVDSLLSSPFLDLLRLFRNATFHFQRDFVSEKWSGFLDGGLESSQWIRDLRTAFADFFHREFDQAGIPRLPAEIRAEIKGLPIDKAAEICRSWWQKQALQ
jgi:hypothetical protein